MSQILTLEISEQVFAAIQRQATAVGVAPERLAALWIEQWFTQISELPIDQASEGIARTRFERHFGTLKADSKTSLDDEGIDADLAKEYANTHEDE